MRNILHWETQRREICAAVASRPGDFKILLKTKDQPGLVRDWLAHHGPMVGPGNLLIFDNMSESAEALAIYEAMPAEIMVCRFSGFIDILHSVKHSSDLYEALSASCRRFAFLDSDERLAWTDDGATFLGGAELARRVAACRATVIPGIWLNNVLGYADRFRLGGDCAALRDGVKWGKPVLSAQAALSGVINHNTQVADLVDGPGVPTNLFVLHLSMLSVASRIAANLQKLVAQKFLPANAAAQDVLGMDAAQLPGGSAKYVREIQKLALLPEDEKGSLAGSMRILESGRIEFESPGQRQAFAGFLAAPGDVLSMLRS